MTTTGELRAIVEELELVDVGEAASYLEEETDLAEEFPDMSALVLESCLGYIASEGLIY
jgi:xanthine dehydrogenase iron-sulfur cluster and FAD-binding subunit A